MEEVTKNPTFLEENAIRRGLSDAFCRILSIAPLFLWASDLTIEPESIYKYNFYLKIVIISILLYILSYNFFPRQLRWNENNFTDQNGMNIITISSVWFFILVFYGSKKEDFYEMLHLAIPIYFIISVILGCIFGGVCNKLFNFIFWYSKRSMYNVESDESENLKIDIYYLTEKIKRLESEVRHFEEQDISTNNPTLVEGELTREREVMEEGLALVLLENRLITLSRTPAIARKTATALTKLELLCDTSREKLDQIEIRHDLALATRAASLNKRIDNYNRILLSINSTLKEKFLSDFKVLNRDIVRLIKKFCASQIRAFHPDLKTSETISDKETETIVSMLSEIRKRID